MNKRRKLAEWHRQDQENKPKKRPRVGSFARRARQPRRNQPGGAGGDAPRRNQPGDAPGGDAPGGDAPGGDAPGGDAPGGAGGDAGPAGGAGGTRANNGRNPEVFDWGEGKLRFHFTKVRRQHRTGYICTCDYHEKQIAVHSRTFEPRSCTRELAVEGDDAEDISIRTLKKWALGCALAACRRDHMNYRTFKRAVPVPLPTHEELDAELEILKRST